MCVTKVITYNIFILIYQHLKTAEYFCLFNDCQHKCIFVLKCVRYTLLI